MKRVWLSIFLLLALVLTSAMPVFASEGVDAPQPGDQVVEDDLPDPLTVHQKELKQQALEAKINGKASGEVKEVAHGQYVELERKGEGAIWTVMGEFPDLKHNLIPAPDRTVNNTTLWVSDFSRQHMLDLLFKDDAGANSMRNFYKEQSSGRYAVHGDVTDWLTVPGAAADYDYPQKGTAVWNFIRDSVNAWYAEQKAAGKTDAEINEYLSQFDKRDRYDYDGDGNFNEPDGYIDTFQSVHAGEGEEAGAPSWTIWSHSWYAYYTGQGAWGPEFNKLGGVQVGNSNYWVGKYTIQPENGGVGVFTHEFGHDLGLPDLYDTAGGENGTGFWTLMSSGSWMGDGTQDIGSMSSHMGAWEKYQLGWLNYQVAYAGKYGSFKLGPMETNTKQAQGLFVVLPPKPVESFIGAPFAGSYYYYSSAGDKLNNLMYRQFTLPAGASLSAKVKYNTEATFDFVYLIVSTDGGVTWSNVPTNLSDKDNPSFGISGISDGWVDLTADLSAFSGSVLLGFRYSTDENTGGFGFMVDDINVTGSPADGAETPAGWTFKPTTGFHVSNGTEVKLYGQYYVAEYRQYYGYDKTLKVGPYFFGYLNDPALQDYVDHFPYQDGLLISFWDTTQANNQTKNHPGHGLLLPVDAHYKALRNVNGAVWRNRIQTYDSTFSMEKTDMLHLHVNSVDSPVASQKAVSVFDDTKTWYDSNNPQGSVIVPNTNTQIRIVGVSALGGFMQVEVRPAK